MEKNKKQFKDFLQGDINCRVLLFDFTTFYKKVLLSEGELDPNYTPMESLAAPVLLAAARGNLEVLKVLR